MSPHTRKSRRPLGRLSRAGLAVAVAALVGAGPGAALASAHGHDQDGHGHDSRGRSHGHGHGHHPGHPGYPGDPGHGGGDPGHGTPPPPNDQVPGIDYTTQPQDLVPPVISVLKNDPGTAPGDIFIAPKAGPAAADFPDTQGPEIIDNEGRPIFFQPIDAPYDATDLRVQSYRGQPVITYTVGQSTGGPGHSEGEDVILNQHYQQIATVSAGNGLLADQHEFDLTPYGTALITVYNQVPYDLSSVGGPVNGSVLDGIVQEVDIATGKVLFQWDSLQHVPLTDSYQPLPANPATPYDFFHINSVNLDSDGNLLISARHTWTVYKVDHHTGDIIWHLGGKESDFQLGPGVQFAWQHNALAETGQPGTIRVFDNGSNVTGIPGVPGNSFEPQSAIKDIKLDTQNHTATLVDAVTHPDGLSAGSQGNAERLPTGGLFVGWGQLGRFSEFDADGNLIWDGQTPGTDDTYRAYRSPWVGEPLTDPTAVATRTDATHVDVKAIWNGATEVDRWLVLGGDHRGHLSPVGVADWNGLSTEATVRSSGQYVELEALDSHGHAIGTSPVTSVTG
jgi:hypothetical protein